MLTRKPRGTEDILPGATHTWHDMEEDLRKVCRVYAYEEIRTPVFEHTELFLRGVGETTDIVNKEMYTFTDRGGRSITLRPEGTAAVVRAYLEAGLHTAPKPVKLFYLGPMFRYERPQSGRLRQFHQFGVEVLGSAEPVIDAEVIALAMDTYRHLGLSGLELHVNSVGCPTCRTTTRAQLIDYYRSRQGRLCSHCLVRLEQNPLRLLDCKEEACRELASQAASHIAPPCAECMDHFDQVLKHLDALGLTYTVDRLLVRGLDYYTRTAFEIMAGDIGAQSSICGGGRYDGLVAELGGPETPGVGFAMGLERVFLLLQKQKEGLSPGSGPLVFVAACGEEVALKSFELLSYLRSLDICADGDFSGRSLKAQLKKAARAGARLAIIVGPDELERQMVTLRDMASGSQREVLIDALASEIVHLF